MKQRKNSREEKLPLPPFIPTLQDPKPAYPFSVVHPLATLTRRTDTFLSLREHIFTDACCTHTWNCTHTPGTHSQINLPKGTHATPWPLETHSTTQMCPQILTHGPARVHMHTHTPQTHSDIVTGIHA